MPFSVLLQAGHQNYQNGSNISNPGSTGTSNSTYGWYEYQWTPIVADAAASWLTSHGETVYREDAYIDSNSSVAGAQAYSVNYAVFIHFDGSGNTGVTQASVGYSTDGRGGTNDAAFANYWEQFYNQKGWTGGWHSDNFTSGLSGYYGYSYATNTTAELVLELGTMTNNATAVWLDNNLTLIGQWIGEAIYNFASGSTVQPDLDARDGTDYSPWPTTLSASQVVQGTSVTMNYRASNWGPADAPSSTTGIYWSYDNVFDASDYVSSHLLATDAVGALTASTGSNESANFSTSGLAAGNYYIFAVADYAKAIPEANEANNPSNGVALSVTSPPQQLPDFDIYYTPTLSASSVVQGGTVQFSYYVTNWGGNSGASTSGIYLSDNSTISTADTRLTTDAVAAITGGGFGSPQHTVNLSTSGIAAGTYYIGVIADYNNAVGESDDSNNASTGIALTVTAPVVSKPDLIVSSITPAATSVSQGAALNFSYVVANSGGLSAVASYAGFYVDQKPNTSLYSGYNLSNALSAGASQTFSNTLDTSNLSAGQHTLWIGADNWGYVGEGDETNNWTSVNFTVTAPINQFNIAINFSGNAAYKPYFDAAAARWQQVITADLPDVNSSTYGFIDDLLISASVVAIDGAGGILGQAGPDDFRSGSLLPDHGNMMFDSADLQSMVNNGTLATVILHEIGHILGIGTLWGALGLKSGFNYTGADALAAYRTLSGNASATYVQLETGGGSGTAGAHWSEAIFGDELMTGYVSGTAGKLSILSIGALDDLGYSVNYTAADAYTMPGHVLAQNSSGGGSDTGNTMVVTQIEGPIAPDNGNGSTDNDMFVFSPDSALQTSSNNNLISGLGGNDHLVGGEGGDTFVFNQNFGRDAIANFQPGQDAVQFDHADFATVADIVANMIDDGLGNTLILADASNIVTIKNISMAVLQQHQSDFHIV